MLDLKSMYRRLYESINRSCCHIAVSVDGDLVSEGSGFAFLPSGEVLTSAHVITGRVPIREEDYRDSNQKIMCKFPFRPQCEYRVAACGMNIRVPDFAGILQIDIALLVPASPLTGQIPHLVAGTNPPQLGELVFAAGYSDELTAPFGLDQLLSGGIATLNSASQSSHSGYLTNFGGPIIKQGYIGNTIHVVASSRSDGKELHVDLFYMDNSVHSGASGGPICNVHGEAVGVITKRSVTSASQENAPGIVVPSGCTIGIGLQPLRALKQT